MNEIDEFFTDISFVIIGLIALWAVLSIIWERIQFRVFKRDIWNALYAREVKTSPKYLIDSYEQWVKSKWECRHHVDYNSLVNDVAHDLYTFELQNDWIRSTDFNQ